MKKIYIKNPTSDDFSVTYDILGNGNPKTYIIKSQEIKNFEPIVARHIVKHLATKILNNTGVKTNWEAEYKQVKNSLYVDI